MKRLFLGIFLIGCPRAEPPPPIAIIDSSADAVALEVAAPVSSGVDAAAPEPVIAADDVERALFLGAPSACSKGDTNDGRIRCMLAKKYSADPEAMSIAVDLFKDTGDVAAVQETQTFNGGFRGTIQIVPELPVKEHRKHLANVAAAMRDFDALFATLKTPEKQPKYRLHGILFRFFRSVGRTTPSAYASGWTVSFNVSGSLLQTADGARETLFHEIFHSNDFAHGHWSSSALRETFDAIMKKCGTQMACLAPYAPSDTIVRGGTYYAFQPDNGDAVNEYAAELALRWYKEHRALKNGEKLPKKAFKCGPPENAKSWKAIVTEFFGGIDSVPRCE